MTTRPFNYSRRQQTYFLEIEFEVDSPFEGRTIPRIRKVTTSTWRTTRRRSLLLEMRNPIMHPTSRRTRNQTLPFAPSLRNFLQKRVHLLTFV
jgi:hypothetical protein